MKKRKGKLSKTYNLAVVNPKLAKEWHPTKNGNLTSKDVTPKTHKKVWWRCNKDHEWQAKVSDRSKGNGCPYCSGRAVCKDNCLQTVNPSLAKQWHPTRNGKLTPKGVTAGSGKRVWWKCSKRHVWQEVINARNRGCGCPYCSGHRVSKDTCLQAVNPVLAREWHKTKNGKLTPRDVTRRSGRRAWWRCNRGHVWLAIIDNRTKGSGCPYCWNMIQKGLLKG